MKKYTPISKQSKRAQKEYYSSQRQTWNGLNPATRTMPNGKGYDRNKMKQEDIAERCCHGCAILTWQPLIFMIG